MCDISCEDMNDYDIQINSEYYENDYDEIDTEQSETSQTESDILFE